MRCLEIPTLTPEVEAQLKKDIEKLYFCKNPIYSYREIIEKLQFGVPGTPYEKITWTNFMVIQKYREKLKIPARNFSAKGRKYKKKVKHNPKRNPSALKWQKIDKIKLNEMWQDFDGTFSEFIQHVEKNVTL